MEIKKSQILKNKDILATSGYALIIFTLWSIVKALLYFYFAPDFVQTVLEELTVYGLGDINYITYICIAVDFAVKIFIGLCAIGEGKKHKNESYFYIILSFVLIVFSLISIASDLYLLIKYIDAISIVVLSLVVDLILTYIIISIAVCAIKNKKYKNIKGVN